jgi:hypothetical protein
VIFRKGQLIPLETAMCMEENILNFCLQHSRYGKKKKIEPNPSTQS